MDRKDYSKAVDTAHNTITAHTITETGVISIFQRGDGDWLVAKRDGNSDYFAIYRVPLLSMAFFSNLLHADREDADVIVLRAIIAETHDLKYRY